MLGILQVYFLLLATTCRANITKY